MISKIGRLFLRQYQFCSFRQNNNNIKMDKEVINPINVIKENWGGMSKFYQNFDSAPQTFYFSLINALSLHEAHHILEVGCGRCTLLPFSLQLKNPDATYLASDLTP